MLVQFTYLRDLLITNDEKHRCVHSEGNEILLGATFRELVGPQPVGKHPPLQISAKREGETILIKVCTFRL